MRLLIASDIHGSSLYCAQLLAAYRREKADRLLLLGDILYHGPRNDLPEGYAPKEVIALLNPLRREILAVRGNCDAEVDQMVLDFPVLADYALLEINGLALFATHGHVYNEAHLPPLRPGDVLLNGHTHVPKFVRHEDYIHLNPGSVSIPKENSPRGYVLLSDRTFDFKTLNGELWRSETV